MGIHLHDGMTGGDREFKLRAALLIYWGAAGALVMSADVHQGEGAPQLLAGAPVSREHVENLVRGIQGTAPINSVNPANVLLANGLRLAWWTPASRRRIWFNARQQKQLQHVSRNEVMHPPLLFVADPGRLFVYALAGAERPENETPVYQAPYLNVYADGWICAGGVQYPSSVAPDSIPKWEHAWFESEGAHPTTSELTRFPGGHDALWTAMLSADRFPVESLVPTGLTVLDVINRQGEPKGGGMARETIVPAEGVAA